MQRTPHPDLTPLIDLNQPMGAGPVRIERPLYVDLLPPCNAACPAGENIQAWLALAREGRFHDAWLALVRDNPLPGVHGRVCYHPCEDGCNRTSLDSSVSIHAVERLLGDMAVAEGWRLPIDAPATGKRVLVVGAGPSGLSAGYHLARLGHSVEIRDAGPMAGGMIQFGIPAYRMPRAELAREIDRIAGMGVTITLNHKVMDLREEMASGGFDAAFVAVGAHVSKHVDIPARDAARVLDAVGFLRDVSSGDAPRLGRRVVIYGGGNTAMDAARTARRLGAEEAMIVYHRDRAHMPAHAFEADEAIDEGVKIKWLTSIKEIDGDALTVEIMEIDADGRPQPTGKFETLKADSVVLALGQQTDSSFLAHMPGVAFKPDGVVIVGPDMMTGADGVFAGGDMVPGQRTVTTAVGHGKKAARHIDAWLRGGACHPAAKHPEVSYEMLHLPIFSDADQSSQPRLAVTDAPTGFAEVMAGLTKSEAQYEAARCLSCGNCFECDQCFAACPELAIEKLGPGRGYAVRLEACTGCAVCYDTCPCHAIEMIPEAAAQQEGKHDADHD